MAEKTAREIAVKALLRVHQEEGYSNLVLDGELQHVPLSPRDKGLVSALFYGVLERTITLNYYIASHSKLRLEQLSPFVLETLRVAVYQILYMDKIPPSAAVNEAVNSIKRSEPHASGYANAVLRAIERDGKAFPLPPEKNRVTHLSVKYSCPKWLIKAWERAYGEELCHGMLPALLGRPPLSVRVNSLRISREELIAKFAEENILAQPGGLEDSLSLRFAGAIEQTEAYRQGLFHVQDVSSQLCAALLGAQAGDRVLDVCSAPGGKAFTIAQRMKNQGELLACDLHESRVRLIQSGAERLGLSIVKAQCRDAVTGETREQFDRILCDVPCSGLGILRRKPEIREKSAESLDNLPDLQYCILCRSASMLRPGGRLIYSTCTLRPEENDRIIARFLEEHPEFAPDPLELPSAFRRGREEPAHQITLFPQIHGTDGFFVSAVTRLR